MDLVNGLFERVSVQQGHADLRQQPRFSRDATSVAFAPNRPDRSADYPKFDRRPLLDELPISILELHDDTGASIDTAARCGSEVVDRMGADHFLRIHYGFAQRIAEILGAGLGFGESTLG